MKLSHLLREAPAALLHRGDPEREVTAVSDDSRQVEPGALFVAVPGFETDGHRYLEEALGRGAIAVLVQEDRRALWEPAVAGSGVAVAVAPDTRRSLADVAAAFYGHPARQLRVVGITGTKGKTTTAYLTAELLEAAGQPVGVISSVEFKVGATYTMNASQFTTPQALEVQRLLRQMVDAGLRGAVIESTSHGLALHRLEHCEYDVAVFTNLSPDHLDFHPTLEDYRGVKARLFRMLGEGVDKGVAKTAVLNADDPAWTVMRDAAAGARILTYGIESPQAELRAPGAELSEKGSRFRLITLAGAVDAALPLTGLFNVYNSLAATGAALALGAPLETIRTALAGVRGVPGRMERMEEGQPFTVVVDYAHTPDSLRAVLRALRAVTAGRLIAVFGCGGDRDPGRRTGMGRVATELADFTVLCNDNPRSEDPAAIIAEIAGAMVASGAHEGTHFVRIPDRRDAMRYAFEHARPADTVLVAGKGHEPYLIVGTEYLPWDDRQVAREVLHQLGHVPV